MLMIMPTSVIQAQDKTIDGIRIRYSTVLSQDQFKIDDYEITKYNSKTEMTIVIENTFWDLKVNDKDFSLILSFNNVKKKLIITWIKNYSNVLRSSHWFLSIADCYTF